MMLDGGGGGGGGLCVWRGGVEKLSYLCNANYYIRLYLFIMFSYFHQYFACLQIN